EVAPGLRVGGSVRLRYELQERFDLRGSSEDFLLTQLRFGIRWQPLEWLGLFAEAQDARIHWEDDLDDDAVPNALADDLDLHQAFAELGLADTAVPFKLRVGRQKLKLGSERLVSPLEWANTARVFDAARLTL